MSTQNRWSNNLNVQDIIHSFNCLNILSVQGTEMNKMGLLTLEILP